jgi:hypothetical protein
MTQQVTQDPQEAHEIGVHHPVWAWASLVGVAYIMVLSVFELGTSVILIMLFGVAAIVAVALWLAPRYGATRTRTAVLLVPLCAFALFGAVYGFAMLEDPPQIVLESKDQPHLRDPLLLAFGFVTTAGALGLDVNGWARGVVLLQVLLLAVAVGAGGLASARGVSRRMDQLEDEIKQSRDSG